VPAEHDPSQLTDSDIMFKPLPPGRGWLTGGGRNALAAKLHNKFEQVFATSNEAVSILGFLHYTEETMGPRQLAAVDAIAPTVAKKSAGDAGATMRNAVEQYTEANPELERAVSDVKAAEHEVMAKSQFFLKALTDQNLTSAKRKEKKAEEDVKEIKEKIETTKKWFDEILDGTFKVLTGEWKDALKDLGKFALKELVVGPIAEAVYEKDLETAKKNLAAAKVEVEKLQDDSDVHAVMAAAEELKAAKDKLEGQSKALVAAGRRANAAHRTLVEKLSGMGKAGERAAAALESRQEVAESAQIGNELLGKYQALVTDASHQAHVLSGSYKAYVEMLLSPGGEQEVPNAEIRVRLHDIASTDQATCDHLEWWCGEEQGRITAAQSYIASGAYMKSYKDIDDSLASAVANR
jgi:hypothetical protein